MLLILGLAAATAPLYLPPYTIVLLISIFMYIVLGVSWTTFCVPANYISLATAAFFGIGVYVSAILQDLPLAVVIFLAGTLSFLLGLVVGLTTLRLSGMYFCIFTFGLSEFFRHGMVWYEVNVTGTVGRWLPLLGIVPVYYYLFTVMVITLISSIVIRKSKFGLALRSIGQGEEAAAHLGININAVKIVVFAITCFFMGAAGAIMAKRWSYIDPDLAFAPFVTFFTIMMVLTGGWNAPFWGPIVGAGLLMSLADTVLAEFPNMTMFFFGAVLLGVIMFFPAGIIGVFQKREWRLESKS